MSIEVGKAFDAAPFAQMLPAGDGLVWEDVRELHRVAVVFDGDPPEDLALQYWRCRWPDRRLPKDRVPGGANVGWWEMGNWFTGAWQTADAERMLSGNVAIFAFSPLDAREFPGLSDFSVRYRTTLKMRAVSNNPLPRILTFKAYTDSVWSHRIASLVWAHPPQGDPQFEVFNGEVIDARAQSPTRWWLTLACAQNPDPNTQDRTLLTVVADDVLTVRMDDLDNGPIAAPDFGFGIWPGHVSGDYPDLVAPWKMAQKKGVYDAVTELPEQTWARAWSRMVPKREPFYLPLGMDGGRHKFGVNPDGSIFYRTANRTGSSPANYIAACPGQDTPFVMADREGMRLSFDLPERPVARSRQDGALPISSATWKQGGLSIGQIAFVTTVDGCSGRTPPPDALGVLMVRFAMRNETDQTLFARLPLRFSAGGEAEMTTCDAEGVIRSGNRVRAVLRSASGAVPDQGDGSNAWVGELAPGTSVFADLLLPYYSPDEACLTRLAHLDWDREHAAVSDFWKQRIRAGTRLATPEPMLNDFFSAHAVHLLINCEIDPDSDRRFARVGSFKYGVYPNESVMMAVELDRRGYHSEARACLETLVHHQGSVPLPGDYGSSEGVFYGASGYECGGYNQHHGWAMWGLVSHYRFTRDDVWLKRIAPGLMDGCAWVIRERVRMADGPGRGLLPHGSLEDIGDWWQWLSSNAYTWMGLNAAGWGLEKAGHPEANRVRQEADTYRASIAKAFWQAAQQAPLVRLRDGVSVPHFPSHVQKRGRTFGWICEVLEGAIHLLQSGVLDARSREALWILKDYEDNLYLSPHYGYDIPDFDAHWFDWGGFTLQACLVSSVDAYLQRGDVKHALRALFNAIAVNFFADTCIMTEHAAPRLGDWRGDHFKTSDEANACGWLRHLFIREDGDDLLLGQAVPLDWLASGQRVGLENACTHFGVMSLFFQQDECGISAFLNGPARNSPVRIRLCFRPLEARKAAMVTVDGRPWSKREGPWIDLPGNFGQGVVRVDFS